MSGWVVAAVAWACVSFAYRAAGLLALSRHVRASRTPADPPADLRVALLRPLCGAPGYLDRCLASLWRAAERGGASVYLAIEDPADPAHEHLSGAVRTEVHTGETTPGKNRKIANLIQLKAEDAADVLVLSDADIDVPGDYVARAAEPFADPEVGFATAPYRSVPADSAASRFDALLTNLHFLPNTCFAVAVEGLHFGLGSTLAVRREALAEIGGLAAIVDESGDDLALAHRIEEKGWKLVWLPLLVDHVLADVGLRAGLARHLRCHRITRNERPRGFLGLMWVTHGWLGALLAGVLGGMAWLPIAWWGGLMLFQWRRRAEIGARGADLALAPLVDAPGFALRVAGDTGRPTPPPSPVRPRALP